ncbi:flippase [Fervidobacterium thailandense]|uniref:Uncharacterized protein n=1 Tax=Fervidobacterium thailandense TaxID=1008305 RepID=A0A1E3G0P8_9BACT|nr:flippase [Fervidobacterium thailandense]ODN29824.1 hypothetical protein A4H02_08710 [Fervidobacterium thailandense]
MGIARNYVYNVTLTIMNLLIPFVTTPYITRVLDPEGIGSVAFTASIVQYFVLLATLGIDLYGTRELAVLKNNPREFQQAFWNIFFTKLITFCISFGLFFAFIAFYRTTYMPLFLIQSISIVNALIDITFLYSSLEDFKSITIRGIVVRIIGVGLLFTLVKKPSDFYIYAVINVATGTLGNIWMWLKKPKELEIVKPELKQIKEHLLGSLKLFIPLLAIQVYVVLDKTMVGILSNESEVAYYDMSQRLVKMALGLVTAIGPVMIPRMSNILAQEREEEKTRYVKNVFEFVTYSSVIIIVLIVTTMQDFVPIFFGSKFLKVKELIIYVSPIILFISWSNLFGMQIMVPMKKEKYLTISVLSGAIVNFTMNMILIPKYKALGAVIGTVVAEFIVTFVQMILTHKIVNLKSLYSGVWKHFLSGLLVLLFLMVLRKINFGSVGRILMELLIGAVLYILLEWLLKTDINNIILKKIHAIFVGVFK